MIAIMGTVKEWFGKHLYFSKATMCIRGLVFSHSFVDHAIMSILVTYLTSNWIYDHFQMAAVVENMRDGLSDIMVIFLARMSHTYRSCFKVIVTTNAAFLVGLGILWWSAEHMSKDIAARVFYGAAVLLTLGEAGRSAALKEFLDEQYLSEQDQKECIDDENMQDRQKALWNLPWFLGAVVPLSLLQATWERTFQISTIGMGIFYLIFWVGYSYYFIHSKSPRVTKAETMHPIEEAKRDETCMDMEELAEPEGRGNIWGVVTKKMKDRKHLRYEILAAWLTILVYSVVAAAGGTFFFEQMSNLNDPTKKAGIIFNLLASSSKYISSRLWELLIPKKWKSNSRVRIGCGMVCTVLCCVAAWQVEFRRLNEVEKEGVGHDTSAAISMSIFWLVPQFSLLGIMEGLAIDGLIDFFVDRVAGDDDKAMVRYYGSRTTDFIIGVGKLLTALSILAFRQRWFDDSINMSRLDKYYRALTFMTLVSFFFYVCVSTCYGTKDVSQDHAREENGTNSHRIELQESPPSQQYLSTSQQESLPSQQNPSTSQQESPPSQQNLSTSRKEPQQLEPLPSSQQEQPLHSHQDFQYHQQLSPLQHQQPYQESPLSPQNYRPQGYPPLYPLQAYSPQSSPPQPQYPLSEKTKDVPSIGGQ